MLSDELLTVEELASYLKLKPRTLYPKLQRGELPAFKVFKEWRFKKSDIDKWLAENIRQKTEDREAAGRPGKTEQIKIQQPV